MMPRTKRSDDEAIASAVKAYLHSHPNERPMPLIGRTDSLQAIQVVADLRELLRGYDRHEDTKHLEYCLGIVMHAIGKARFHDAQESKKPARRLTFQQQQQQQQQEQQQKRHHRDKKSHHSGSTSPAPEVRITADTSNTFVATDVLVTQTHRSRSKSIQVDAEEYSVCDIGGQRQQGVLHSYRPRPNGASGSHRARSAQR